MEKTIARFHCTIMKLKISILYHVIVNSQSNRDNLTRCCIVFINLRYCLGLSSRLLSKNVTQHIFNTPTIIYPQLSCQGHNRYYKKRTITLSIYTANNLVIFELIQNRQ